MIIIGVDTHKHTYIQNSQNDQHAKQADVI